MSTALNALRAILPGTVALAGGRIADWALPLWPEEARAIAAALPARRAEFAAGRSAARAAMAALGAADAALPPDADRVPGWPPGLTGSISHAAGHALAAVARRADHGAVGLDLEAIGAVPRDLLPEIATAAEIAALGSGDPGLIFSAKEAVFKAIFPACRRLLGFHDIAVAPLPGGFEGRLTVAAPPFAQGARFAGRQIRAEGLILSAVILQP